MSLPPLQPLTRLDRLWLAEAVRLTESHAGPLEDAEANRRARAVDGGPGERILVRAESLAARDGLRQALAHWRQSATLVLLALGLFALLTGGGLAAAAVGDGVEPVNVFWALGSLLGLHLLSLAVWLVGPGGATGGALARLWFWLSAKLARDGRSAQLAPALLSLLGRHRLTRWGFGVLVHGFWLLVLVSALLSLLALFAARRYGFAWETTLLGADSFVTFTWVIGSLPSLLGFPTPEPELIRASGDTALNLEAARQAWAGWLLGALLVYGVLPRLLLLVVCLWRWNVGARRMSLDLALPEYVVLRERLQPSSEPLGVHDPAPDLLPRAHLEAAVAAGAGAVLVAVELDDRHSWPPALPAGVADAGILNDRRQRQRVLEQLTRHPPARLVIACDPQRTVDRGTLKLIAELARTAAHTRVWLVPPPAGTTMDPVRLDEWRAALRELQVETAEVAPLRWLETGHD